MNHLQQTLLMIAKDIDILCRKNNIEYYLMGGSAIGAVRHKGFIPWDDDFDIVMNNDNYQRFIRVCKTQLNNKKYYFQEGQKDWPLNFSKIKLKGTHIKECEGSVDFETDGIFIDIFKLDNVANNKLIATWQYICAKYHLCYLLGQRTYRSASFKKKIMIKLANPLKFKVLRNFIIRQVEKFNRKETNYYGSFYSATKYKNAIINKKIYGKPIYVDFEDTKFPIQEHYHKYLTIIFGDYKKLPPVEQRKGSHIISIDFGKY